METHKREFEGELEKLIKHRSKYIVFDFAISHIIVWISIITSFSASILIASDAEILQPYKIPIAILSGISGLCIIIEKTFDFANRSFWGNMYKIDLQELKDAIEFGKIDKYEASKKMRKIIRKNETDFIKIGSFFRKDQKDNQSSEVKNTDKTTSSEQKKGNKN